MEATLPKSVYPKNWRVGLLEGFADSPAMSADDELERIKLRKLRELMRRAGEERAQEFPNKPIEANEKNFDELIQRYDLVVADFWAEWCGPCWMIAPIIEELAKEYSGKVVFLKLNVDRNRRLAARFGIMSIPTLIIFKNGKPVDMVVGAYPKPLLEARIRKHLS